MKETSIICRDCLKQELDLQVESCSRCGSAIPTLDDNHLLAILEVFKLLSHQDQRNLRNQIFRLYWKRKDKKQKMYFRDDAPERQIIERVTSAFDQAGVLVINNVIDSKLFFDLYAGMVIRIWKALEEDTKPRQERNPEYAKWFALLNKKAIAYYLKIRKEDPPEIYRAKYKLEKSK